MLSCIWNITKLMQNAIYIGQGHMKVDVTQRSRSQSKAIIRLSQEEIKVS